MNKEPLEVEVAPVAIQSSTMVQQCMNNILAEAFSIAEQAVRDELPGPRVSNCSKELAEKVVELSRIAHASRGALLTLSAYKCCRPSQDVRCNKTEHPAGFSARSYDAHVTVPFLMKHDLPRNVETHWLSQTLSYLNTCWTRDQSLTTIPKKAGPLLIDSVNLLEETGRSLDEAKEIARDLVCILLYELIQERNRGKILLTRPKFLTISQVTQLLSQHFEGSYRRNTPRLPQLAVYAMYECLRKSVARYSNYTLLPLAKMKAADRKLKTIGDIVLLKDDVPVEAVETKLKDPVSSIDVAEAIAKIRSATVDRYFVLSTGNVSKSDRDEIAELCSDFRASNGCEIIPNGVIETIGYYLRLLPSTLEYVDAYATLVETDGDLGYEHRTAWNQICMEFAGP